jgi:hypothetical protein
MSAVFGSKSSNDLTACLLDLVHGYRATCIVVTALKLGLIDALRGGPMNEELLATTLGAHRPSLQRFLRALKAIGLVENQEGGISLSSMGRLLLEGDAGVRERAILVGEEYLPAWQALAHSVMTGETAFDNLFGMSAWEHRKQRPELNECLNRTMADDHLRTDRSISAAYDFSASRLVVDVGGGQGALIAEILLHCPHAEGLVFDQPHVVEGAAGVLSAASVRNRCQIEGGSFFDSVPAGGDTYILQHILHDWNDERCEVILRNCRTAMGATSTLLVIENIMPGNSNPSERQVMLDIHMMAMLGGRERTRSEYQSMLQSAGLQLVRSVSTRAQTEILVALPSGDTAREMVSRS